MTSLAYTPANIDSVGQRHLTHFMQTSSQSTPRGYLSKYEVECCPMPLSMFTLIVSHDAHQLLHWCGQHGLEVRNRKMVL